MTKWFAWFQAAKTLPPVFKVIAARDLDTAIMIARELAGRDKVELIGVIVASEQFNPPEATNDSS